MDKILEEFREFRRILCICPCCGSLERLSDLHIKTKEKAPKTWLDIYEGKNQQLIKKENELENVR